jgi:S1-C subfamily serine protease
MGRPIMRRLYLIFIAAVFVAFHISAYAEQSGEEILNAVVKIHAVIPADAHTAKSLGTEREGNGVVIDSKGHILTIGYLILEAETLQVFGTGDKPIKAVFVGYDHKTGFGLLRADEPLDIIPMKLGKSSEIKEGEPLLIAGYGGKNSVQAAQVISRREFAGSWEYLLEDALFTVPPYVNYGGAALVDREGQLVGIGSLLTQVMIPGFGSILCNIFVPIDHLKPILSDMIAAGHSREAPRPWLGINTEEVHGRIFITQVVPESPAEKAGLKSGDIVLAVSGKPVNGLADFYRKVWALGEAGTDVPLSVLQGIQTRNVSVHSTDRNKLLRLDIQKVL